MIALRQPFHRRPLSIILGTTLLLLTFWVISPYWHSAEWEPIPPAPGTGSGRVAKVSMLYGKRNSLYERALRSHQRHATRWGYPMHVLREDISVGFWNKPSYLLSLVIQELAKPPTQRVEWLMWIDADSIILNDDIPVEIFLPPHDITDIHMVTARDQNGLNTGIVFFHVHPWTISMLIETLAHPLYKPEIDLGRSADQEAMVHVLNKTDGGPDKHGYKDGLIYLPRPWINTYEWHHAYEGKRGNLLVHFPGLEEDRWSHMSKWLDVVEYTPEKWRVQLAETEYATKTVEFWNQVRTAKRAINATEERLKSPSLKSKNRVEEGLRGLKKVLYEEADDMELLRQRIDDLKAVPKFD
ncbi:hypothetical protein FE257_004407 [Aspergillus nanangensis]|uniref:Galactosyl transferase GMA12/MNN10 family protein n=1 Tax=Aspergillus nanangensis TaxID=2582783 RepID=A0AAD4CYG7_ASPNN|nr:hypothetical protein FE257_004407 [Aspergillus nanangensis]